MRILVSACLLGLRCRYDGRAEGDDAVMKILCAHTIVPFCPEVYGGLPTPRAPAEIVGDRVLTASGGDVTAEYAMGAKEAVRLAKLLHCTCAVLRDRSPSCGVGSIHDGGFHGGIVRGDGITALALQKAGIAVYSAEAIARLGFVPDVVDRE